MPTSSFFWGGIFSFLFWWQCTGLAEEEQAAFPDSFFLCVFFHFFFGGNAHRPSRGGASRFSRRLSPDPPREIEYVIKRKIAIANHHAKKKNARKKKSASKLALATGLS
jgi:hypothetical protein